MLSSVGGVNEILGVFGVYGYLVALGLREMLGCVRGVGVLGSAVLGGDVG